MAKGKFIVFEGGEGTGKTTQIKFLEETLRQQGREILLTREPGGTNCPIAEDIRILIKRPDFKEMVPETEFFLFLAARSQHVRQVVIPALNEGKMVLCDRFAGSTFAYQHFARGLFDLNEMKRINRFASAGMEPDLTLYLDIDPILGLQRIQSSGNRTIEIDRLDQEALLFHQKVRNGYQHLALTENNWKIIDASLSINEVKEAIWNSLQTIL